MEAEDIVKVMEGGLLRLNTDTEQLKGNIQILWTFENGKQSSRVAQYHGKIYTHYDLRFSGRVQLDERTGDLSISNISTHDSGLYNALIVINKQISKKKYKVDVYGKICMQSMRTHWCATVFEYMIFKLTISCPKASVSVPDIKSNSHENVQQPPSKSIS